VSSRSASHSWVYLTGLGGLKLTFAQVCGGAIIGWDTQRLAIAVVNYSAIASASGVSGARDSALDLSEWLALGVGLEVTFLARGALERHELAALIWPWLEFKAVGGPGTRGTRFELPWSSIRALWITADGMIERLAG